MEEGEKRGSVLSPAHKKFVWDIECCVLNAAQTEELENIAGVLRVNRSIPKRIGQLDHISSAMLRIVATNDDEF
jgi:hypothetical protein